MSLIKPLDERTRRDWSLRLDGETVPRVKAAAS